MHEHAELSAYIKKDALKGRCEMMSENITAAARIRHFIG